MSTGTTSRPTRSSAVPPRSSSSGRSTSTSRSSSSPTRGARCRVAAVEFFGDPTARAPGRRGHRDERQDDDGVSCSTRSSTAAGRRPGLLGTVERASAASAAPAVRTTPEAIDLQRLFREMLDAGDRSCAMEATSHGSELGRLDGVRFAALVFTNLTQDHLDFHGTMEAYFEAKRRLFAAGRARAVNVGDEYGRRLAAELPDAVTFGFADDADVRADALDGVDLKLRGRFNVENALGALAAARLLGIDRAIAIGRARVGDRGARTIRAGRRGAALHGARRLRAHARRARERAPRRARPRRPRALRLRRRRRPRPRQAAADGPDRRRARRSSRSSRPTTRAARSPTRSSRRSSAARPATCVVEPDRRRAIERALEAARPGDVVVIAGKGHEQGQEFADRTLPFDDREVARERSAGCRRKRDPARARRGRAARQRHARRTAPTRSPACRSTRAGSSPATSSSRSAAATTSSTDARARGAAATLVPDDAFAALAALGRSVRDRSDARVVGDHRLDGQDVDEGHPRRALRAGTRGPSRPRRATTTRSACRSRSAASSPTPRSASLELAMRGFGQIAELAAIARAARRRRDHDVGPVHLELVGDVEGVARAKAELIAALAAGWTAVVPADASARAVPRADVTVRRFAADDVRSAEVDARPDSRGLLDRRPRAAADAERRRAAPARQRARRARTRTTRSACRSTRARGCRRIEFSRWRGEELALPGGGLLINDAYNANPVSMRAALDAPRRARRHAPPRRGARRHGRARRRRAAVPRGVGAHAAELGVDVLLARRRRSRGSTSTGRPRSRWRSGDRSPSARRRRWRRSCSPATACSSRRRARWGSSGWRKRSRGAPA